MFRSVLPLAFAVLGAAQEESAPVGIVRADVSVLIIRGASGTMDLSTSAGEQYQCDFDSQSLFERDQLRIQASDVRKGEFAEVVSDRKRGRCYARIVRLIPRTSPTVRSARATASKNRISMVEHMFPRGNLTFSGLVVRTSPGVIVLRTRAEPEKMILLRQDTRFLNSGMMVESDQLTVNSRVFVRASKNIHNDIEAYQVVWGDIGGPKALPF